jgi:hypothetical protein
MPWSKLSEPSKTDSLTPLAPQVVISPFSCGTVIGRWAYQAKKEEEEQINVVLFVNEN